MLEKLRDKAMELLLSGDNPVLEVLRNQFESANVSIVENTGVGLFVEFAISNNVGKIEIEDVKEDFVFGDVYGTIDRIFGAIGFIVFVENGYLKTLEIYSIGLEFWEQITDDINIEYDSNPRNLTDLEKKWKKK